jgi:hypothetical protein
MALATKPRWDKYDGYMGNFRGVLAEDIDLDTEANVVLGVGLNSDGAVVIGSGQTGIKGLMIVPVGADIHGNLLDGGINNQSGDPCDVGKHGEIVNFVANPADGTYAIVVTVGSGSFTLTVNGKVTGNIAFNATNTAVEAAIVAVDDNMVDADVTVTGTAPNFSAQVADGFTLAAGTGATVTAGATTPVAGQNYYAHADGSVTATKGSDGVYVGHTAEKDRLIVNVLDATP